MSLSEGGKRGTAQASTSALSPTFKDTSQSPRDHILKPHRERANGRQESSLKSVPCLFVASCLHPYQSCVADARQVRVVHYPNLNACLIHEGRHPIVDCQTTHFGYAVPVKFLRATATTPPELVFDSDAELDPHTAGYLLNHHPDLIALASTWDRSVTATSDAQPAATMPVDPQEAFQKVMLPSASNEQDIQAIAQQISDHAEVIYQTWKAKGLSPVELLQYHNTVLNAGKTATSATHLPSSQMTSPPPGGGPSSGSPHKTVEPAATHPKSVTAHGGPTPAPPKLSPVDLLASPSLEVNLEVLVNNFVQEDKARLARQRNSPARSVRSASPSNPAAHAPSPQLGHKKAEPKPQDHDGVQKGPAFAKPDPMDPNSPRPAGVSPEGSMTNTPGVAQPAPTFQSAVQYVYHKAPHLGSSLTGDTVKLRAAKFAQQAESPPKKDGTLPTLTLEKRLVETCPRTPAQDSKTESPLEESAPSSRAVSQVYSSTTAAATTNPLSHVEQEEQRLIHALQTNQYPEEPAESVAPLKLRHVAGERRVGSAPATQRWSAPYGRPGSAPSAYLGEEELETLVDKLRSLQRQNESAPRAASLGRDWPSASLATSPRLTRENSPSRTPVPKLSESVPAHLSAIDYAKVRFQNAQAHPLTQQRMEDNRIVSKMANMAANLVTETRHRFENGQVNIPDSQWRTEWVPGRHQQPLPDRLPSPPEAEVNVLQQETQEVMNILRKKGRKGRKGPEPGDGPGSATPASLPHPELTVQQKQHLRERSLQQLQQDNLLAAGGGGGAGPATNACGVPVRPFLTRGSVAERVLLFEKAPSVAEFRDKTGFLKPVEKKKSVPAYSSNDMQLKTQNYNSPDKENQPSCPETSLVPAGSTLRREAKTNTRNDIPKFHFPFGRPASSSGDTGQVSRIAQAFQALPGSQATRQQFGKIAKACGLPLYWKVPLFLAAGGEKLGYLTADVFLEFWQKVLRLYHDEASRFMFILNSTHSSKEKHDSSSNYLLPDHFIPLLQDVVEFHPGLTFLKAASEFHSRYIHTVVARIFYCVNRSWSGRVTLTELRHSNLLDIIRILEEEEDINQITDYFSYEHFYVIYCKFWELDRDHDLFIDRKDLARHNEHALSSRIIDRIFSGAVTRGGPHRQGTLKQGRSLDRMSYTEFVWFLIAEEDKRHPTAVEYWFRCMDLDGDGYLSMYELEYFYEEQLQRMETLGIESLPFEDCLCQMLDMVNPAIPGKISLKDLRQCRLCPVFFDTFFNLDKFLDHEQRDPFACQTDPNQQVSDWDRYAAEEYELLVAEESGSDQVDDIYCQEDGDADMTEDSFGDEHAYPVERRVPLSSRQATY